MWIPDCFLDALPLRETDTLSLCKHICIFIYANMLPLVASALWHQHRGEASRSGAGPSAMQQCECLQKKLTLKVSNEMKCPSDKYKRQQRGRGVGGEAPKETHLVIHLSRVGQIKLKYSRRSPTAQRVSAPSLWPPCFPIPYSAFTRVAKAVGIVCVWGEWQWAWWGVCIDMA